MDINAHAMTDTRRSAGLLPNHIPLWRDSRRGSCESRRTQQLTAPDATEFGRGLCLTSCCLATGAPTLVLTPPLCRPSGESVPRRWRSLALIRKSRPMDPHVCSEPFPAARGWLEPHLQALVKHGRQNVRVAGGVPELLRRQRPRGPPGALLGLVQRAPQHPLTHARQRHALRGRQGPRAEPGERQDIHVGAQRGRRGSLKRLHAEGSCGDARDA